MIPAKKKILLDVGGTFIKCSDGRSVPVDSNGSREDIVRSLREAVWGKTDGRLATGGGQEEGGEVELRVAVPGKFDYGTGQFLMTHKFSAVYGENFADLIGLPRHACRYIHDVNCMLLGEHPEGNTALVALGTGLGYAMFIDGQILRNPLGSPLVSIWCRPFHDGILEDYASKRGVLRLFGRDDLTVKEIADLAHTGNARACAAFAEMGSIIGEAISPILEEYKVETLLLGGQISRSADLFSQTLKSALPGNILAVRTISDFDNATFKGLELL